MTFRSGLRLSNAHWLTNRVSLQRPSPADFEQARWLSDRLVGMGAPHIGKEDTETDSAMKVLEDLTAELI